MIKKHDAHVRTAWIHFFPFKMWCFTIIASMFLGFEIGIGWQLFTLD